MTKHEADFATRRKATDTAFELHHESMGIAKISVSQKISEKHGAVGRAVTGGAG